MKALSPVEHKLLVEAGEPFTLDLFADGEEAVADSLADAGLVAWMDNPMDEELVAPVLTPAGARALRVHEAFLRGGTS